MHLNTSVSHLSKCLDIKRNQSVLYPLLIKCKVFSHVSFLKVYIPVIITFFLMRKQYILQLKHNYSKILNIIFIKERWRQ